MTFIPPFLHLKEQATCLINLIMSGMYSYHHAIHVSMRRVVLLIFHPAEHMYSMFQGSGYCDFLQVTICESIIASSPLQTNLSWN
jgi:hypothetical protein